MRFNYHIICNQNQNGFVSLNAKLLKWGLLQFGYNNNQNIWLYIKSIFGKIVSQQFKPNEITRLFAFLVLNRVFHVQYVQTIRIASKNNLYICTNGIDYYHFCVYLYQNGLTRCKKLLTSSRRIYNGANNYYACRYDYSANELFMDDPSGKKDEIDFDFEVGKFYRKIYDDFRGLDPEIRVINQEEYMFANFDDGTEIGLPLRYDDEVLNSEEFLCRGFDIFYENMIFNALPEVEEKLENMFRIRK